MLRNDTLRTHAECEAGYQRHLDEAADRALNALESAMVKLAKNSGVGHWREDLADKRHRFLLVYSNLIVYRHEVKPLQIVRLLHAACDCRAFWDCRRMEIAGATKAE